MAEEQTKAEVKQAVVGYWKTWRDGDAEAWKGHVHGDLFGYYYGGGLMFEGSESGEIWNDVRTWLTGDLKSTMSPAHITVKLAGKDAAVATFYVEGSETLGGRTCEGTWRASLVLSRHEGRWKALHFHYSPLVITQTIQKT